MAYRACLLWAVAMMTSCTRQTQTDRMMTWSEETHWAGMTLPRNEKIIVLRFVEDPGQGLIEDWNSRLRDRLVQQGNPVRVTFDCWRLVDGTFGFNVVAIGGEPYIPAPNRGPSRAAAFGEGPSRPNPLEAAIP